MIQTFAIIAVVIVLIFIILALYTQFTKDKEK